MNYIYNIKDWFNNLTLLKKIAIILLFAISISYIFSDGLDENCIIQTQRTLGCSRAEAIEFCKMYKELEKKY